MHGSVGEFFGFLEKILERIKLLPVENTNALCIGGIVVGKQIIDAFVEYLESESTILAHFYLSIEVAHYPGGRVFIVIRKT